MADGLRPDASLERTKEAIAAVVSSVDRLTAGTVGPPPRCASWKYPSASAADLAVGDLVARYDFVGPDHQHQLVAKAALLELLVDRVVFLAAVALRRCDSAAGAAAAPEPEPAPAPAPEGLGGAGVVVELCQRVVELRSDRDRLEAAVQNREAGSASASPAPAASRGLRPAVLTPRDALCSRVLG